VQQLRAVDVEALHKNTLSITQVRRKLAVDFVSMFETLSSVMAVKEARAKASKTNESALPQSTSNVINAKRRLSQSDTSSAHKRPRTESDPEPVTPDQSRHTIHPGSGDSVEIKDEENTKQLLKDVLNCSLAVLEDNFWTIKWPTSGNTVLLDQL
jgi:hypothetical protein